MRKVLSFSAFLMMGLLVSQILPGAVGEGYTTIKSVSDVLLYICLSFIMINVGREFVMDKTRWKSYAEDYFIAMATAAMPWILIAVYYVFVLLPPEYWHSWEAWKENLLLSRFAAPTSAGILFTMLAALGLKSSWIYKKIQVLAIFDDLDTILLMIPLQIMMVGLRWQLNHCFSSVCSALYRLETVREIQLAARLESDFLLLGGSFCSYTVGVYGEQIFLWRRRKYPY